MHLIVIIVGILGGGSLEIKTGHQSLIISTIHAFLEPENLPDIRQSRQKIVLSEQLV